MLTVINLNEQAAQLASSWKSKVLGNPAGVNFKVLRMDGSPYPDEVRAGEVCIVPAGVPHGVAEGSHGTLVIIDPAGQ